MRFGVLGPLLVETADGPLAVGGATRRAVLATLLCHPNRVVPVASLVDAVWDEDPPASAVDQVRAQVSGLRRLLGAEVIVTRPSGYLIRVEPAELDTELFERDAAAAAAALAEGRVGEAAAAFRAALGWWRGAALSDVGGRAAAVGAAGWDERRLAVLEGRIAADLDGGHAAELVGELRALVEEHPLRERLRAQLMTALHRAGRRGEALEVYRRGRRVLVDELGLEPGAELAQAQQAVLAGDAAPVAPPTRTIRPAQLPTDLSDLTGRDKQTTWIDAVLAQGGPAVPVAAISGRAGVGKTSLAVHAAHRLRPEFPDGQLYVDLRGADPDPADTVEVLGDFLRALGTPPGAIPDGLGARSQAYRSLLAGRRTLVVADNAATAAQIRPLIPGSSSCAVLVTSRPRLVGLSGARLLDLDVLDPEHALELLTRVVGPERAAAEPEAAEQIVGLCGGLPLALRVAGARLAAAPHWRLARLADRLAEDRRRLDELAAGDLEVRASLALSDRSLDDAAARGLRLLGLLDAPDFASWVAAPLLDLPSLDAEEVLERLVAAQLLEPLGEDLTGMMRYRFHDLVRLYARERAAADEPRSTRGAAVARLLGATLTVLDAVVVMAARTQFGPGTAPRRVLDGDVVAALSADPRAWLERERPGLVAAVEAAGALGLDETAWEIAAALAPALFDVGRHFDDWHRAVATVVDVTRRTGNRRGEAIGLMGFVFLYLAQERHAAAEHQCLQAQAIWRDTADPWNVAVVEYVLAVVRRRQGRLAEALQGASEALRFFEASHDEVGVANLRYLVGFIQYERGEYARATEMLDLARAEHRSRGDVRGEAFALHRGGLVRHARGDPQAAAEQFEEAMRLFGRIGDRAGAAKTLCSLAAVRIEEGTTALAQAELAGSLEVLRELHDRTGEALTLHTLADLHLADGHVELARQHVTDAVRLWDQLSRPLPRARSLQLLGDVHVRAGDPTAATDAWHEALTVFEEHEAPEAAGVRTRLADGKPPPASTVHSRPISDS